MELTTVLSKTEKAIVRGLDYSLFAARIFECKACGVNPVLTRAEKASAFLSVS